MTPQFLAAWTIPLALVVAGAFAHAEPPIALAIGLAGGLSLSGSV
jgi:hypothetical protein